MLGAFRNGLKCSFFLCEEKRPPERSRRKKEDNVKTYLKGTVSEDVDRIQLGRSGRLL
jgi:hypothetical protein